MTLAYPQFGNTDYGGFTTDEEIARRFADRTFRSAPDARSSPLIGAPIGNTSVGDAPPSLAIPPTMPPASGGGEIPSVSDTVAQLFRSKPVTAVDWILIFIIIIAVACFFERACEYFERSGGVTGSRAHHHMGGNFCSTCGGTV
jgi:hypothetical protein